MTLAGMFEAAGISPSRLRGDADVVRAFIDSRACVPGSLFVAMPGGSLDPHSFLASAVANGAVAAIVHDEAAFEAHPDLPMALLAPGDYPDAMWRLMDALYYHPSREMTLIGVTGTNGKTTVAWLVRGMLAQFGWKTAYLGTLGLSIDGQPDRELSNTTPFCVEAYDLVAQARDAGVQAMAMEVSSHALAERRVDGLNFKVVVYTNLTQDHLDFHGTMEAYRAAKLRLFRELPALREPSERWKVTVAVGNADDPIVRADLADVQPLIWFSRRDPEAQIYLAESEVGVDHIRGVLQRMHVYGQPCLPHDGPNTQTNLLKRYEFEAPLGGDYNVENLLAAIGAMSGAGYTLEQIVPLVAALKPVPGRFEPVANDLGIGVLVDYAHTPDALEKVLDTAKALTKGRLIAVFGCGGDRDRSKRPKMARAASERADLTVVTSDNPRTEDAGAILAEVLAGIVPGREALAIEDRREAVAHAIAVAEPGDTIVIAGKGHEDYQILGREKVPMDDRELAREALARRERGEA